MFGLAFAYTAALICFSFIARKRAAAGVDFFVGGRSFNKWTVAFCITGLFSGSTFIAILETAYLKGVSAFWYGVAEMSHVLIIAFLLIGPLRKKMLVTISGLIGDKYGRLPKAIAGAITALTFPMWSVATALAFASCINAITGLDLIISVAITAVLLYIYLVAGGMWSVALTQTINFFIYMIMFAILGYAFLINPGMDGLATYLEQNPVMADPQGVGLQNILAWFGTFWINVLLAQAAFQMALSCKTAEEGRKGLIIAAGFNIIFIVMGILIGVAAHAVVPDIGRGLVAVPTYLMETLPAPLVGMVCLGIWACALGWGAPCQFSGATSLGRDVGSAIMPKANDAQLIRFTRWSLALLTILMIFFGYLRSEQSAWWNIFAWTARNGATFAPVVTALFWPVATRSGVIAALLAGFGCGLLWNHLGGWAVGSFFLNTHPVWVGMTANIVTMTVVSLLTGDWRVSTPEGTYRLMSRIGMLIIAASLVAISLGWAWMISTGLIGMFLFILILGIWLLSMAYIRSTDSAQK